MSIDYSSQVVVGYITSVEEAFKGFLHKKTEVFHLEDRYDTRTGALSGQVKIVDEEERTIIKISDKEFDGPFEELSDNFCPDDDALLALGELVGCTCTVTGDYCNGEFVVCFEPSDIVMTDGVISIASIISAEDEVKRIGKALEKLGIDPGAPGVHSVMFVA